MSSVKILPAILITLIVLGLAPALIASAAGEEVLIVAMMKYIKNPNPLKQETWYDWWLNIVTYEYLFREDPSIEPVPWLCKYYEASPDGLVWTFKILDNVYWHDGVKLTVKDIAFTIDFYKKYKFPDWYPYVEYIDKYEIIDDYTIKLYLKEPYVWILRRFGFMLILPEHIWKHVPEVFSDPLMFDPLKPEHVAKVLEAIKKGEPPDIASKVEDFVNKYHHLRIGAGPFILARWVEGELLEMVKNPNYFKEGFPRVDKLIYKVYKSPETEYMAVKTGEVHIMVWTVPYAAIEEAEKDPNIILPKTPDVYIGFIGFNLKDPIIGVKNVRKAIAYAIDRKYITETLMLGYAEPVYTFVHPMFKKWVDTDVPEYDGPNYDLANKLLDEAGFKDVDGDGYRETPDGKDFEITILTPSYDPVRVRIGDLMVEWLKNIGIKLVNRPVDFDTLIDLVYNQHNFQMYIIENDANFMPWYYSAYYVKEQYVPGGENPWGFINDTFEKLLKEAERTVDIDKRVELYKKMQEILAEELPILPLYVRYWMQAYRKGLSGVVDAVGGALNFWTLINANFRGIPPELPITKLETPTTTPSPTTTTTATPSPTAGATTITVTKTETVTKTVTKTSISPTTVTKEVTPVGQVAAATIIALIIGIAIGFVLRRR